MIKIERWLKILKIIIIFTTEKMPMLSKMAHANANDSPYNPEGDGLKLNWWTIAELFKQMQFEKSKFTINPSW
jgi:hypothetical protein